MSDIDWEGYLPPDGTPCEGYIYADTANQGRPLNQWVPGVFVGRAYSANGGAMGLLKTEDGRVHAIGAFSFFRPVRTPEQVAEAEREEAIAEMWSTYWQPSVSTAMEGLGLLYDAGYRKQEVS